VAGPGAVIPAAAAHCLNTNGSDDRGRPFQPRVSVGLHPIVAF
jgi:hypothetical protein